MAEFNSGVADNSAILNAYMYLDIQDKKYENKSLEYILDQLAKEDASIKSNEYYIAVKQACDSNKELAEMTLVNQSHVNYSDKFDYSGAKCTDDPIQACAFKDKNGNLYVVYRGTGDRRWGDNGQGFVYESTDMQIAASDYFDYVIEKCGYEGDLYVTGHSKGGNEAQFVTLTSNHRDEITSCYSFDGQGFSDDAIENLFKSNNPDYEQILKKMYSINGDNDPVHNFIGVIIPEDNTYYTNTHYTDSNGNTKFSYFHDILGMITGTGVDWQKDEEENIIQGQEGWLSEFGKVLNENIQALPTDIKGSCAIALMTLIDVFKGGSMDDAKSDYFDFLVFNSVGIPVVLFTLTEFAVAEMYEKYGIIGAITTAIVSTSLAVTFFPIIQTIVGAIETAYIISQIIESTEKLVAKVKALCKGAGEWVNGIFNTLNSYINKLKEWVFKNSVGYKYSTSNPYININTSTMRTYATQLRGLSQRSKTLDRKMNSLYWNLGINWNTLYNLGCLLKAEVVLDYAYRLDKCASYLEQTASDFDNVEKGIVNSL